MSQFRPAEYDQQDLLIEVLVAQTLDDLDDNRLDMQTALRQIAFLTWAAARTHPSAPSDGFPVAANEVDWT